MIDPMGVVYHFTCRDHGLPGILRTGLVVPNPRPHPIIGVPLAWFTEVAQPDRASTGLTSRFITCDRMTARFVADADDVERWVTSRWRREVRDFAGLVDLEAYGDPEHWFVSTVPVPALLDLTYRRTG